MEWRRLQYLDKFKEQLNRVLIRSKPESIPRLTMLFYMSSGIIKGDCNSITYDDPRIDSWIQDAATEYASLWENYRFDFDSFEFGFLDYEPTRPNLIVLDKLVRAATFLVDYSCDLKLDPYPPILDSDRWSELDDDVPDLVSLPNQVSLPTRLPNLLISREWTYYPSN